MNQKITAVNIADALATKLTFPKKVADLFMHAFCDTIIEGLDTDGIVKVKGLGTFRIVNVDSRESVSVSTGERIVIPSFRKLAFTPEDSVTDRISGTDTQQPPTHSPSGETEEGHEPVEVPTVEEFFSVIQEAETAEKPETVKQQNYKTVEETPNDEFSGIDVLIATPESLEELHDRLAEARQQQAEADKAVHLAQDRLDEAKAQAQQAEAGVATAQQRAEEQRAEVERILQLIENVESNRPTEIASTPLPPTEEEEPQAVGTSDNDDSPIPPVEESTQEENTTSTDDSDTSPIDKHPNKDTENTPWWRIPLILLILSVVGAICYFVAFNPQQPLRWLNLAGQETPATETPQQTTKPKPVAKPEPKDTIVVETLTPPATGSTDTPSPTTSVPAKPTPAAEPKPEKPAEPARPKTHKIRRGDTLTKISLQYYGTKDSVRAIIRANKFKDPNNINEGAVVKLP
ncbi:MAG: HU family DNA-binding protein [Bacteroidales bacterium]|nr:HU family DNA-binding protein [Bacteroidales bacterium]